MTRRARYTPDKRPGIDSSDALAGAAIFLFGCSDEAFARITPTSLARTYRLSERRAGYELTVAGQKRAKMREVTDGI